jgi:predicted ester cyclase
VAAPDSRAAVLEYLALLERHDLDGLDSVVAEDLVVIAPDGSTAFSDRAGWKHALAGDPFSDERIEVEDIVVEGATVALRFRLTAVHSGTAFGVAATGRRITTSGTKVYTVKDGRIVRIAGHDDVLGLLRQLGVRELPA